MIKLQILKTLYIIIILAILQTTNVVFAQIPTVSKRQIKGYENFSSKYVKARNIDFWLPEGYDIKQKYNTII